MLAVLAVALVSSVASADVLWDQSDYDLTVPGFFNSVSGSPPFGLTHYAVSDITVGDGGWYVSKISAYFGAADPVWGDGITEGHLHVYAKTGPLPIDGLDDPTLSPMISMSATLEGFDAFVVSADVNLHLDPGEYWIGITPLAPSGFFGPEPHWASGTYLGDATASLDPYAFPGPAGWFNFNPGADAAIKIEGVVFPLCTGGDDEDSDEDEDSDGGQNDNGFFDDSEIDHDGMIEMGPGRSSDSDTDEDDPRANSRRTGVRSDRIRR
jgi:hypothetical protein